VIIANIHLFLILSNQFATYNVESSNLEVDSDGWKEAIIEDIIGESQQK